MKKVIKLLTIILFIFLITNVEASTLDNMLNTNLVMAKMVGCGDTVGIPSGLPKFVSNIINIIKIATPIILIIMGMIDFAKAVVSNDEKAMKESQSRFIRRVIGGILVFVVVVVIQLIFNMIGTNSTNQMVTCINCFVNNECTDTSSLEIKNMNCYQCNDDSSVYKWASSSGDKAPGVSEDSCHAGYHEVNLTEKECKAKYKFAACYKCNSVNLYQWGLGTVEGCHSGTSKIEDITKEEDCHS